MPLDAYYYLSGLTNHIQKSRILEIIGAWPLRQLRMKMRRTTTRIEIREEMDMAQLASSDLFLVGSVPVASDKPEDVMRL